MAALPHHYGPVTRSSTRRTRRKPYGSKRRAVAQRQLQPQVLPDPAQLAALHQWDLTAVGARDTQEEQQLLVRATQMVALLEASGDGGVEAGESDANNMERKYVYGVKKDVQGHPSAIVLYAPFIPSLSE